MELDLRIANFNDFDAIVSDLHKRDHAKRCGAYHHDQIFEWLQAQVISGILDGTLGTNSEPNCDCQVPMGEKYEKVYCFNCISHDIDGQKHIVKLEYIGTMK
jgi:hypothetical protein